MRVVIDRCPEVSAARGRQSPLSRVGADAQTVALHLGGAHHPMSQDAYGWW
jgi:hypothetical protein